MKTASPSQPRGVALVIVLAFLVIISALAVAFFSSVTTELQASRNYASVVTTRQLAESATSVVMGQVREATARENGAWASQPGMIRVYRDGSSVSDKADTFFKLYSSNNMTVTAGQIAGFDLAAEVPTSGTDAWYSNRSLFTDLNEPVIIPATTGSATVKRYPIMDPAAIGTVEGFGITPDTGDPKSTERLARMPVRWIYVLQDGTLTVPKSADPTGLNASWSGTTSVGKTPAKDNPIVGRIAFWADDDSSKVNINTAAGFIAPPGQDETKYAGSYWDTPRTYSSFDAGTVDTSTGVMTVPGLAACQPAQHEFQRYPGHPATTSLGLVFKKNLTTEQLFKLVPRVLGGGSQGGTKQPLKASGALSLKKDRLYASVDELLFSPKMSGGIRTTSDSAVGATSAITPDLLEKTRFFLTASSRAPELNLFGRPRMTIWPIDANPFKRTPYDEIFAFCSTIGGKTFHFSRNDPNSAKKDATVGRNKLLYAYLQELTGKGVPGFGTADFKSKYTDDRDQILTEILDYIRCINLKDSSVSVAANDTSKYYTNQGVVVPLQIDKTSGFGRFPTISEAALVFYHAGFNADKSKQLLRAYMVFETFNPMFGYSAISAPSADDIANGYVVTHEVKGLDKFRVKSPTMAAVTALGFPPTATNKITSSSVSTWHGRDMGGFEGIMHTLGNKVDANPGETNYYQLQSYVTPTKAGGSPGVEIPAADTTFKFTGGEVTIKVQWAGQDLQTLKVKFPDSTGDWPLPQLDKASFPLVKGTTPAGYYADPGGFFLPSDCNPSDALSFNTRLKWARQSSYESAADPGGINHINRWRQLIQPGDTVRSVEIAGDSGGSGSGGDMRIIAIQDAVDRYKEHKDYQSTSIRPAHSLHTALGPIYSGATFGKLIKDAAYPADKTPDVPSRVNGALRKDGAPGDWDAGIGSYSDGSYPNKVDEGNTVFFYTRQGVPKGILPYFGTEQYQESGPAHFSPNRQVPSAVMFGSLPSRVIAQNPWETLLFCPNPAGAKHRGMIEMPKDHLLLDLFHMPVVEPYAISEPFSTAGKINPNYQLAPFTYIQRTTAFRAALHALRVTAIPVGDAPSYKNAPVNNTNPPKNYRLLVDRDATVAAIDNFFETNKTDPNGGFFKSASQICERFIYPAGVVSPGTKPSAAETEITKFWDQNILTGDNLREKPYADLYPRLTTKSNTYTVHFRVQTLRQRPRAAAGDYAKWEEGKDGLLGEYRGSTTIERYVDPQDRRFDKTDPETTAKNDFVDVEKDSLEAAYRFRIVLSKKFSP